MAESVSRILIKSSTVKPTPNTGDLQRAELAYSYASDKLFIGDELGQDSLVIGGQTFLKLFKDVLDDDGNVNVGIVFPENVIVAGANNTIDSLDIDSLKVKGKELITAATNELITDNNLSNVTDTKLVSSKAIKDYVDERTTGFLSNFSLTTPQTSQILVANNGSFENVTTTGAVEFYANGHTEIRDGYVQNQALANQSIKIGSQEIKLGESVLVNLNLDTSGVLDINRGGTGRHDIEKDYILLGNGTNSVHTTNDFYFDTSANDNVLFANANAEFTLNVEIGETLQVSDSLSVATNKLQFREFFQVLTVGGGNSFDSSIISYDMISEYFSFSSGTVLNVSSAGLVNILSPALFFGPELTTSANTVTNIHGLLNIYNDTEYSGNALTVSSGTETVINGLVYLNNDVFINGNTLNVSSSTTTTLAGPLHSTLVANLTDVHVEGSVLTVSNNTTTTLNGDVFITGNSLNIAESVYSELYGNVYVYSQLLNTSPTTISTFDGPVIINGTLNVSGDVVFEGNTSYIGDTFTVSNNTLVEINGDTTLNGTELVVTSNTTVEGKATFNETVDVNGVFKVYNDAEIKGDLVVEKDLYVFGNSVQVLTETLTVEDNIIVLGANNSADVVDLGFAGRYNENGNTVYAGIFRDATDNKFYVFENYPTEPPIVSMTGFSSSTMLATIFANVEANTLIAHSGTLDSVVITNSELNNSFADNLTSNNATLNDAISNNLIANNSTLDTGTIVNYVILDSFANNLTSNNATLNEAISNNLIANNSTLNDAISNNLIANNSTLDTGTIVNYVILDSFANNLTANNSTLNDIVSNNLIANNSTLDTGTIVNYVILDSFANNLTANNSTLNYAILNNATLNGSLVNNLTGNNASLNNSSSNNSVFNNAQILDSFANNLTSNNAIINDSSLYNVSLYNSYAYNLTSNNIVVEVIDVENIIANNIIANTYSGIYLDMLENVNDTATANQVLTADGTGNFFFADAATELKELTDVDSTASADEILTAYGNGEFYFSNTLTNVQINNSSADNLTSNNTILQNSRAIEEFIIFGDGASATGKLTLNCEVNSHYQSIVPQPHFSSVTNILTLPAGGNQELVGTTALQTLTNKTLTSPTINSGIFSNGVATNLISNNATINDSTLNSPTINDAEFVEQLLVLGVTGTSGKLILNCEVNTHGQTIIAQPHSAGVTNILTLPAGGDQELVGTTATQTLTNKTLTSPVINTATFTNAIINDSTANNLVSNNSTLNSATINDSIANNLVANNSTINSTIINNSVANNLVLNDATLNSNTTFNGYVTINNSLEVSENVYVDGDLFVNGNTVTLDAQTLTVEDNIVVLGSNNVADITDLGFAFKYFDGASDLYAGMFRDATDEKFYLFKDFITDPPVTTMTGFSVANMLATLYGDFEANNLIAISGNLENVNSNNSIITNSTISDSIIDCGTF